MSEVGYQKIEDEKTEIGCQRSDVRRARQEAEVGGQRAEDRGRRSEGSRLRKATPSQGGRRAEVGR